MINGKKKKDNDVLDYSRISLIPQIVLSEADMVKDPLELISEL